MINDRGDFLNIVLNEKLRPKWDDMGASSSLDVMFSYLTFSKKINDFKLN